MLVYSSAALADPLYQCKDANGAVSFQQKRCEAGQSQAGVVIHSRTPVSGPTTARGAGDTPPTATEIARAAAAQARNAAQEINAGSLGNGPNAAKPAFPRPKDCRLPWQDSTSDLEIYAVTSGGSFPSAGFAVDESGGITQVIDAVVNAPGRKVALMLSNSGRPTIWNLQWTPSTDVRAVWASGSYANVVSGLPKNVPVLETRRERGSSPCPSFVWFPGGFELAEPMAAMAFARPIKQFVVLSQPSDAARRDQRSSRDAALPVIGAPVPAGTVLQSSSDRPVRMHENPAGGRVGAAGLAVLVQEGALRQARRSDLTDWRRAWLSGQDAPPIIGELGPGKPEDELFSAYVVQRSLRLPEQLHGGHSATFVVPKGIPVPSGELGHSTLLDFNSLTCRGLQCPPEVRGVVEQTAPVSPARPTCALPWVGKPAPTRIYAIASPGRGTALHMPGDSQAISVSDIVVNLPGEDVALILSSNDPRLWGLRWSAGTRIVAIYASGPTRPRLYGAPASVPLVAVSRDDACPPIDGSLEGLTRLNAGARRAFGKPVTAAILFGQPGQVHIGKPLDPTTLLQGAAGEAIESLSQRTTR